MIAQKFSQFEIGQPFYLSYNDGSYCIYKKTSKSTAEIVCVEAKNNLISCLNVGTIITNINPNEIFGKILK